MNLRNVARRIRRNLAGGLPAGGSAGTYGRRLLAETKFFSDNLKAHELPAIYDYWSNTYLRPQLEQFGFSHPEAMFLQYFEAAYHASTALQRRFLSVGTGNCETEIRLAQNLVQHGCRDFVIDCLELNAQLLANAAQRAQAEGVAAHIRAVQCDFNKWQPASTYDAVLANNSLHHVLNLEGLIGGIKSSLAPTGSFVTSDMIGRNGHMRWPEALAIVLEYWPELPQQYTYNHLLRRHEATYDNWDCSVDGFEGIRAQDILPLLIENFEFDLFVAFANVIDVFIDRPFGHNFQVGNAWDIEFIDRVAARDADEILRGAIKPCHILAAMCNGRPAQKRTLPGLTPEFCVRSPEHPPVADRARTDQPVSDPSPSANVEAPAAGVDYSDLWWCPQESGWGLSIHHHGGGQLVANWLTYGPGGEPVWYTLQQGRWTSPATFESPVFATTGPHYAAAYASRTVAMRPVGTATLQFIDERNAQFSFAVDGNEGCKAIGRMRF